MLIRLTYASRTRGVLGPADVKDIVQSSQRNNGRLGVTGALLLANGVFLQCLEGDSRIVNALYHRIVLDARHQDTCILNFAEIQRRLFVGWSMGLVPSTEENLALLLSFSPTADFNPFDMKPAALDALLAELLPKARLLNQ